MMVLMMKIGSTEPYIASVYEECAVSVEENLSEEGNSWERRNKQVLPESICPVYFVSQVERNRSLVGLAIGSLHK